MIRLKTGFSTLLISLLMSSVLWASDPVWIDVRSSEEYAAGHVELAVNIPYTEIRLLPQRPPRRHRDGYAERNGVHERG